MIRATVIFGTRPEAIKLSPLILALRARSEAVNTEVVFSGQHADLIQPIVDFFGVAVDSRLSLMKPKQSLASLTSGAVSILAELFARSHPDYVIVQGDTTTAMTAALAAFYQKIPVAHLEAGLRSNLRYAPFPEEINRRFISQIAELNWAPTQRAADTLKVEGLPIGTGRVAVTGNTGVDAALLGLRILSGRPIADPVFDTLSRFRSAHPDGSFILITGHRRENAGAPIREICRAVHDIAVENDDVLFVYAVHPSPDVMKPVNEELANCSNVVLTEPKSYPVFLGLMAQADALISDSGGIQEEAPALGKLVFVTRGVTERPEALQTGHLQLVGTDRATLKAAVSDFLRRKSSDRFKLSPSFPYGDGRAADRCVASLLMEPFAEFEFRRQDGQAG